jgi:penicillin-binding protein 2
LASTTTRPPAPLPPRPTPPEKAGDEQASVETYRLTPKLARRVALLGGLVVIGFAALFMRLWALQVLAGSQYAARAQANQVRTVRVDAPRGPILDRNGNVLVTNEPVTSVELSPAGMPKAYAARAAEVRAIARVAGVSVRHVTKLILERERAGDLLDPVVVRTQATAPMQAYLEERAAAFPGLTLARSYIRRYPHGSVAAQLLGYDGQIPAGDPRLGKDGYEPGDVIGLTGIESGLDMYLRGVPGAARVRVDSLGRPRSPRLLTTQPQPGQTVRLTIDTRLQIAAQSALQDGIQTARNNGQWAADGGAIVALDPRDGSILALASSPTYNPSVYSGPITNKALNAQGLGSAQSAVDKNYPALDRALDAEYPPGSAFKPLTAIAALEEHLIKPYAFYPCTGTYTAPEDRSRHVFHNWDPNVFQGMDLPTALARSCDTYFYPIGNKCYLLPPDRGQPLQRWARKFGFGATTGVDVRPEATGLVPTIGWKHRVFTRKTDPTNWRIDRLWKPGDSITLAIGQGDLLVTPIQMTRLYAAIANGGKLVTPHVLMDVQNTNGTIVPTAAPPAPKPIPGLDPAYLKVVRQGLFEGTHDPLGTSYGVFGNFPYPIAGKTGTAQKVVQLPGSSLSRDENQSWWCGYGPANDPKLVVCAVIENGGEGGAAAAPAAERVFAKFFNVQPTQLGYIHSD